MDDRFFCFGEYDEMHPRCLLTCPDRIYCIRRTNAEKILKAFREKEGDRKDVAIYSVKTGKGETPLLVRSPFFNKSEVEG